MKRHILYASLSLCALAAATAQAATPSTINGGGAASQEFDYAAPDVNGAPVSEFFTFDTLQTRTAFGMYWATTSGAAQTGMLNNDLTCIINKSTGANGGNCSGMVGGADTVHYAIEESTLSPTQISQWASSPVGQVVAGNLIQIPAMGTGLAIVVNDTNLTTNGAATFSDKDLCEIFSGGFTDFSQITDSATAPAAGAFKLVYRSDAAGNTFSLTNHLAAVCNTTNTAPGVTFTPTTTFASLFTTVPIATQIPGAYPVSGLATLANTLAGLEGVSLPQAISYISPDWTSVDSATSSAKLSNGDPSPLIVAAIDNDNKPYLPTAANVTLALEHPGVGQNLNPPTTAVQGANPTAWVPIIQTANEGYPIVSYSSIVLPQCYADPKIAAQMPLFLKDHYGNATFIKIQTNNGLAQVSRGVGTRFLQAIKRNILANQGGWNTNIGNATACAGRSGR